ncbi:uncharacterized protein LOC132755412 isoform X2 [Ruditapes philippinarum]|uniref:uncharacterized protein LOC132755412 isoform X2 n=1 Tax=Ruditapes philippinarum TaxID=129788 RepID=UPI00295AC4AC|nr:uncharacterized protein LOC132755412 isoform X2 [Ruditapes philippinarum]
MFASAGIHVSRGLRYGEARHVGLHHFSSSMGTSSQRPFRKGVVVTTVSGLVLIVGIMITVLGFMDVFDTGYTMMGMLMIAVSVLLFLGALRMFLLSAKLRKSERTLQISRGTVASMVIEREDERGTLTVVMDTVNIEARSDDGSRPPDYAEATSDYYPESTSEIVIDTVNSDPPPPYGPPTYDQAMAEKESEMSISEIEDDNDNKSEQENINPGQTSSQVPETVTEPDWERDQYISHGYQDMPSVTI